MFNYDKIKTVQLELTMSCNAACPQCARNVNGIEIPNLPKISWTIDKIKSCFSKEFIEQLDLIYFCGSHGDPFMCVDFLDIAKYFTECNPKIKIGVHTNGSLRSTKFYEECAKNIDFIAFAIDGLEDTNHLYRKNCKWTKIIDNASAFINAGGHAEWDYVVFKHNQHQVNEAKQVSERLGFKNFNVKKTSRFLNYNHKLVDYYDTSDGHKIYPPTDVKYLNKAYDKLKSTNLQEYKKQTCISCNSLRIREIYISADGYIFPCGWLSDRVYQTTVLGTNDNIKILEQIKKFPSNIFKASIKEIVNGEWFKYIKNSWTNNNRLDRCAIMCGSEINIIGEQNTDVSYKI